jgi:hypothetical protein
MTKTKRATSIHKVRRDALGGKRGQGHQWQREGRKVRRPRPECIADGRPDPTLTSLGGLASFGRFTRRLRVEDELRRRFGALKCGAGVVYPMAEQLRLLLDVAVAGEDRVFALEALSSDQLFVRLAGGMIPASTLCTAT